MNLFVKYYSSQKDSNKDRRAKYKLTTWDKFIIEVNDIMTEQLFWVSVT